MGLFKGTQEQYYGFNSFKVAGSTTNQFTLDYPNLPTSVGDFNVYIIGTVNGVTKTTRTLASVYSTQPWKLPIHKTRRFSKQLYGWIYRRRQNNKQS